MTAWLFYAFDLLHLDGADLRPLPLVTRKEALARVGERSQRPRDDAI